MTEPSKSSIEEIKTLARLLLSKLDSYERLIFWLEVVTYLREKDGIEGIKTQEGFISFKPQNSSDI